MNTCHIAGLTPTLDPGGPAAGARCLRVTTPRPRPTSPTTGDTVGVTGPRLLMADTLATMAPLVTMVPLLQELRLRGAPVQAPGLPLLPGL